MTSHICKDNTGQNKEWIGKQWKMWMVELGSKTLLIGDRDMEMDYNRA